MSDGRRMSLREDHRPARGEYGRPAAMAAASPLRHTVERRRAARGVPRRHRQGGRSWSRPALGRRARKAHRRSCDRGRRNPRRLRTRLRELSPQRSDRAGLLYDPGRGLGRGRLRVALVRHARLARRLGRGDRLGRRRVGLRGGHDRLRRRRLDRRRRCRIDGRRGRGGRLVGWHGRVGGGRVCLDRRRWRGCVSRSIVVARDRRRRNRIVFRRRVLDDGHGLANRKQSKRIDVSVLLVRPANAEVDRALRADRPHHASLGDGRLGADVERAEMRERNGVAVGRAQAQRQTVSGGRSGVRDDAAYRRENGLARVAADLDAAALTARVRMSGIEGKGAEHRTVDRPRPGESPRGHQEHRSDAGHGQRPKCARGASRTSPSSALGLHACLPRSLSIRLT